MKVYLVVKEVDEELEGDIYTTNYMVLSIFKDETDSENYLAELRSNLDLLKNEISELFKNDWHYYLLEELTKKYSKILGTEVSLYTLNDTEFYIKKMDLR